MNLSQALSKVFPNISVTELSINHFHDSSFTDSIPNFLQLVQNQELTPEIASAVDNFAKLQGQYPNILDDRKPFIWKWLKLGQEMITLDTVTTGFLDKANLAKQITMFYAILLDDVVDRLQDIEVYNLAIENSFNGEFTLDSNHPYYNYIKMCADIWSQIEELVNTLPMHNQLRSAYLDAHRNIFKCMELSYQINIGNTDVTWSEFLGTMSHNMYVVNSGIIDLSASDKFQSADIQLWTELFNHTQIMARIGNWLSTWKREIKDKDYTSGVLFLLLSDIGKHKLESLSSEEIEDLVKEKDYEGFLLNVWKEDYQSALALKPKFQDFDVEAHLQKFKQVLNMHMSTIGLK